MRIVIVACVLLAGCGEFWKDVRQREQAERAAERAYLQTPEGAAYVGCQTKTQFAMAGHRARSILDLEGMAKSNQMHGSCMEYWRRTGQMP